MAQIYELNRRWAIIRMFRSRNKNDDWPTVFAAVKEKFPDATEDEFLTACQHSVDDMKLQNDRREIEWEKEERMYAIALRDKKFVAGTGTLKDAMRRLALNDGDPDAVPYHKHFTSNILSDHLEELALEESPDFHVSEPGYIKYLGPNPDDDDVFRVAVTRAVNQCKRRHRADDLSEKVMARLTEMEHADLKYAAAGIHSKQDFDQLKAGA